MRPVKIGIYGIAGAIEERWEAIAQNPLTLLCHYHLHLDIAKCKSSKHPGMCFMINAEKQVSEEISTVPISIFSNQFSKIFLIHLLKTT